MDTTASDVHQLLTDYKIPIHGVSIGKVTDKSTWRVDFHDTATDGERAMAMQLIINFDPLTVPVKKTQEQKTNDVLTQLLAAVETLTKRVDALENFKVKT